METSKCKKCGKEIIGNKEKCDYCKKRDEEMFGKIGGITISIVGFVVSIGANYVMKKKIT